MNKREKVMVWRKRALILAGLIVISFVLIQIIPMGAFFDSLKRDENPPVEFTIQWDSTETEALLRTACYDCHSNETVWPWYSYIAPVSWLVVYDVNTGRGHLNFSQDNFIDGSLVDFLNDIEWHTENNMPPRKYLLLHPEANLTNEQRSQLVAGVRSTITALVEDEQLSEYQAENSGTGGMN